MAITVTPVATTRRFVLEFRAEDKGRGQSMQVQVRGVRFTPEQLNDIAATLQSIPRIELTAFDTAPAVLIVYFLAIPETDDQEERDGRLQEVLGVISLAAHRAIGFTADIS